MVLHRYETSRLTDSISFRRGDGWQMVASLAGATSPRVRGARGGSASAPRPWPGA